MNGISYGFSSNFVQKEELNVCVHGVMGEGRQERN